MLRISKSSLVPPGWVHPLVCSLILSYLLTLPQPQNIFSAFLSTSSKYKSMPRVGFACVLGLPNHSFFFVLKWFDLRHSFYQFDYIRSYSVLIHQHLLYSCLFHDLECINRFIACRCRLISVWIWYFEMSFLYLCFNGPLFQVFRILNHFHNF